MQFCLTWTSKELDVVVRSSQKEDEAQLNQQQDIQDIHVLTQSIPHPMHVTHAPMQNVPEPTYEMRQEQRSSEAEQRRSDNATSCSNATSLWASPHTQLSWNMTHPFSRPRCMCDLSTTRRTVRKHNQNHGRKFFSCPKSLKEKPCDFFEWENPSEGAVLLEQKSSTPLTTQPNPDKATDAMRPHPVPASSAANSIARRRGRDALGSQCRQP